MPFVQRCRNCSIMDRWIPSPLGVIRKGNCSTNTLGSCAMNSGWNSANVLPQPVFPFAVKHLSLLWSNHTVSPNKCCGLQCQPLDCSVPVCLIPCFSQWMHWKSFGLLLPIKPAWVWKGANKYTHADSEQKLKGSSVGLQMPEWSGGNHAWPAFAFNISSLSKEAVIFGCLLFLSLSPLPVSPTISFITFARYLPRFDCGGACTSHQCHHLLAHCHCIIRHH